MKSDEQNEIARLKELLQEQEVGAKMLLRRDLELARANEKLQHLDHMKSEFISVVAHQLRTPLSATKWALDILAEEHKDSLTSEQKELVEKARGSNERMIRIADDLLKVDFADSGKMQYKFGETDLTKIIEEEVKERQLQAQEKNVTLTYKIVEDLPLVSGDNEKLHAVLQNLIDNAIKYTLKGGTVTLSATVDKKNILVKVGDTGIGIPENDKERIFSKFYRSTNAVSTETGGSGLGLFFVQKIINRHGGEVWFESEVGKGSTFYFTVPIVD